MQFITTDQRIAVENFEVGVVYTVAFTSGDSFTGSCMGIGVDFVAFQHTAPEYIFCLTMTAAADIASIEPLPADIGQISEYTGSVPVSIKTDGSPLLDYLITGNTIQNGTPTPDNPIMPEGCGDLETSGTKAGQYKIPISSANTTTLIYLGEVQTARKLKKLVLTGEETSWNEPAAGIHRLTLEGYMRENTNIPLSTHYIGIAPVSAAGDIGNLRIAFLISASGNNYMYIRDSAYTTIANFKSYLAAQYAAGTPVTVWYILATPETAVVNEPLMRIGDYADTLSYRQSGVIIPTTAGLNIFDIDTTVKPSEVYLKYFSPIF